MKDVNAAIQTKLFLLLNPVLDVPVYKQYIVARARADCYVLISTINNNDTSTMQSADTDTLVTIGIYTKDSQANPGALVNSIAATIYQTIYPTPNSFIDLWPYFQQCGIRLVNDICPEPIITPDAVYINRFLTFRLNVFHK